MNTPRWTFPFIATVVAAFMLLTPGSVLARSAKKQKQCAAPTKAHKAGRAKKKPACKKSPSIVAQPQAAAGVSGPAGPQGAKGDTGATGGIGPAGPQGPAGAQGVAGAQGAPGANGATGATGAPGATGATGAQGPAGTVTSTVATATGALNAAVTVQCPAGKVALSGGASGTSSGGFTWITVSAPVKSNGAIAAAGDTPTGWTATVGGSGSGTATVYAICTA
jgi:hypothetical protein